MPAVRTSPRAAGADREARLLRAAVRAFAAHGYEGASVRAICASAESNVAAVKYYFGDKAGLYAAAIRSAVGSLMAMRPIPPKDVAPDPEMALFNWVRWGVEFVLEGGESRVALTKIILREMREPSPIFRELFNDIGMPISHELEAIIADLARHRKAQVDVRRLGACVLLLTTQYEHNAPFLQQIGLPPPRTAKEFDALASVIVDMAMGAIRPGAGDGGERA